MTEYQHCFYPGRSTWEQNRNNCLPRTYSRRRFSKCHLRFLLSEALSKFRLLLLTITTLQAFFDKLKAFIDFLSLPNYSKEEVRHKRALADRFINPMLIIDLKSRSMKRPNCKKPNDKCFFLRCFNFNPCRITRLMFEEEQRLRRGLELSEMQKLDKLLGCLHLKITIELMEYLSAVFCCWSTLIFI